MADQKYTIDPTISAANLLTAVLPIAQGGFDYKVTPQMLQGNLNNSGAAFTLGSVIFAGSGGLFAENNANFFWNSGSHILSVNTNTDFTGTDSVNVYNEVDAYNPQSVQGAIGSAAESGFTFSSSRGTGGTPLVLSSGDLVGGVSGYGYTGASPSYQSLAGMWVTAQGAASTLGGKLDFQTRADGGALTSRLTIDNTGLAAFSGRATFTATSTLPGINIGSFAGNPSSLSNGDFWYNSSTGSLRFVATASSLIVVGIAANLTSNRIAIVNGTFTLKDFSTFTYDGIKFSSGGTAQSSGVNSLAVFNGRADTGVTTATEQIDIDFNLARSVTWVDGTVATQRFVYFRGPTVNKTTTSATFSNIYTAYFDPATAGTGVTFTNVWAAGFNGQTKFIGRSQFNQTTTTSPIQIVGFTSDPSVPVEGEVSYNTTSHLLKFYNGSSWISAGGAGWLVTGTTTITGNTNQTGSFNNTFNLNQVIVNQNAITGSALGGAFIVNGSASTNITATESTHIAFNLNQTVQFTGSTGFATQEAFLIQAPTYAFVSATGTITDSATVSITGATIQGTNALLTNTHGLLVKSGSVGSATNSYGLTVNAQTGATSNFSAQFLGGIGIKFGQTAQSTNHTFISVTQSNHTGGAPTGFLYQGGNLTSVTANSAGYDFQINISIPTTQTTTGSSSLLGTAYIGNRSFSAAAASSVTDAFTLTISSAPIASTNYTIINSHGLLIQSGSVGSGVTNSYGLTSNAMTGATNNYSAQFKGGLGVFLSDINLVLGTTTGTKIGTSTSQKLGFWNATPIVQPTTAIAASTFVANTAGTLNDSATWDGYTIGQVVKALRNSGILA